MPARILIKADDLVFTERDRIWRGFADAVVSRGMVASIGVIGFDSRNELERDPKGKRWISRYAPQIEVWNHGYYHTDTEFLGQPLQVQLDRIVKAQDAIDAVYGVRPTVFGAPFNLHDQTTIDACEAAGLAGAFGDGKSERIALIETRRIFGFESPRPFSARRVFNPSLVRFWRRYLRLHRYSDLAVMQVHPRRWDDAGLRRFGWILDFLKLRGCSFVRLSDVLSERAPSNRHHAQEDSVGSRPESR